jgi:hypothetical protein
MADALGKSTWQGKLLMIFRVFSGEGLLLALRNILDGWVLLEQLRDRLGYHGMYEILEYDSTLTINDSTGRDARLERREWIKLLQDNVVAIHDHAWGDGELYARHQCQPGIPVDFYQEARPCFRATLSRKNANKTVILDVRRFKTFF